MQKFISKPLIAAAFNVDLRTITRWQNRKIDPLPIAVQGKRGKPHKYDIESIFVWGFRQRLAEMDISNSGETYDFNIERARLTHEQADKVTLENAQLRRELIPREVVEATWSEMVSYMRGRFLGMPTKLAPAVQGSDDLAEIRAILTDGVHEALQEIATNGLPKDAQARIKLVAENLNKVEATT